MAGGIFLVQGNGELLELAEQRYEAESVLQKLLASYPNLVVGDQLNPGSPRRWLFVTRELAIPGDESGSGRWSLDHLFLDQDGIPTLIEVKRSTDTRARREVVGQMLDYAANAVTYLGADVIQARFEVSCIEQGRTSSEVINAFLEAGVEEEAFWQSVDRNLKSGRIRMLFVADEILPELQRIVEFLNQQMSPAEIAAVEIRQFVGKGTTALVPRVLGQTVAAQQAKAGSTAVAKRKWDEKAFFGELAHRFGPRIVDTARAIYSWADHAGLRIWWGEGAKDGSFFPMLDGPAGTFWTFGVWTYGRVEMQFQHLPRGREDIRVGLQRRLNEIPGVGIPTESITKRPSIKLELLANEGAMSHFQESMDWLVKVLSTDLA